MFFPGVGVLEDQGIGSAGPGSLEGRGLTNALPPHDPDPAILKAMDPDGR